MDYDWHFSNDKPIYSQIIEQIKQLIVSGGFSPGDKLPSVRELAQTACVNPNTMQKAMSELEKDGLLYTLRSSGRFITDDEALIKKIKNELAEAEIENFMQGMSKLGFSVEETINLITEKQGGDNS